MTQLAPSPPRGDKEKGRGKGREGETREYDIKQAKQQTEPGDRPWEHEMRISIVENRAASSDFSMLSSLISLQTETRPDICMTMLLPDMTGNNLQLPCGTRGGRGGGRRGGEKREGEKEEEEREKKEEGEAEEKEEKEKRRKK